MARQNPLIVRLNELPPEGLEVEFNQDSGELTTVLGDLIADNPYRMKLRLTPQGNAVELRGEIQTELNLLCSRCAIDLKHPVNLKIYEFLVVERPYVKGDRQARVNHAHECDDSGPQYTSLQSESFDLGAYIHELVALEEPSRPLRSSDCEIACENLKNRGTDEGAWELKASRRPNPFEVLQKLKLKS